jgi:excisionase family DNA binding protein
MLLEEWVKMAKVFTTEEAAELLRVSPRTVCQWLRSGKIPGRKVGKFWLIPEAALLDWLAGTHGQLSPRRGPALAPTRTAVASPSKPIWERIVEAVSDLPEEVLQRLPEDGSEQLDHYVYGWPKKQQ